MSQRKYLHSDEVNAIINAVPQGKNYHRDRCMIMMCFYHGFRVSELCHLKTNDIQGSYIFVPRLKKGLSTTHPIQQAEADEINLWLNERKGWLNGDSSWLFLSRNGNPLSRQQFYDLLKKHGETAGLKVKVHPHMLRHSCGFALADKGKDTRLIQDYLGHRNIQHTVLYTATNMERFNSVVF